MTFLLLVASLLFASVNSESCTALNLLTKFRIKPDGLEGSVFSDSTWTKNFCQLTGDRRQVSYDSGEISLKDAFSQTYLPKTLLVNKMTIRRKANGVLEKSKMNMNITIEITTFQSGTISNVPVRNLQVTYILQKKIQDLFYETSDTSLIRWTGAVSSDSGSEIRVIDLDLFDRQIPVLFSLKKQNFKLYQRETLANQKLRDIMIDSISFIDSRKISPTSLHAPSIRNIFLKNITTTTEEKMKETFGRIYLPSKNEFSDEGVYAQKHHICTDVTKCGKIIVHALQEIVKETVGSKCETVEIVPSTFHASNVLEVFVGSKKSNMKNIQADTTSTFKCDNNGFISLHILFTSFSNEWWINELSLSSKTIKAIIKSMKSNIHGEIFGTIQKDDKIYTTIRNSLFSDVPGGIFIEDASLSKNNVLELFKKVRQNLKTGVQIHDDFINQYLSEKKIEGIFNTYKVENHVPTLFGFLHRISEILGFKLAINQDRSAYMYFTLNHFSDDILSIEDVAISKINTTLIDLFNVKLDHQDQINETEFNSISTMGFKISQIFDSKPTLEIIDSLKIASSVIIKSEELDLVATYDYQSKISNIICKGKALNTKNEISESVKLNTTSVAISLENMLINFDGTLLAQNLPVFGNEFGYVVGEITVEDAFNEAMKEIQKEKFTEIVELKQKIENYFKNLCGNVQQCESIISVIAIPLSDNSGFRFGLTYKKLVAMNIVSDDGTIFSYSSRVDLRILSNVLMSGDLQNDVANNFKYMVTSKTKRLGVAIPFRFNMTSSLTKSSQIEVDINFPNNAKIDMNFDIVNEHNEDMHATIKSVPLTDERLNVIVKLFGAEEELFLSPFEVLDGITQKIFRFTDWYWFNITLPLMQHPMDLTNTWVKDSAAFTEWSSSPKTDDKNLLFYVEIANNYISYPQFNITLNDIKFICAIDKFDRTSIQTMVNDVNSAFKRCQLDSILIAELPTNIDEITPENDVSIPIYPAKGKTNYIWDLKGEAKPNPSTQNVGFGSRLNVFPVFNTWKELSWMMNSMFGIEFSGSRRVTITQRELGIPEYLTKIYPQEYITNVFPLHFEAFHTIDNIILSNELKSSNDTKSTFHLNLMNQTTENLNVKTILDFQLGSVDVSGLNNITIFTNVDGENTTLNSIVRQNQNSFFIKMRVQEKKQLETKPIYIAKEINLPIGMTLQDSLIGWLPTQFPQEIRSMLNISLFDISTLFDEDIQVQIHLHRTRYSDDHYMLPISLEISNSTVPGLNVSGNTPSSEIVVLSKSNFTVNSNFDYKGRILSGSFGVLNIDTTKDSKVVGSGKAQFSCIQKSDFMDVRRFTPLKSTTMIQDFMINILTDSNLNYPNFAVDMSDEYPSLDSLNFKWLNQWKILNRDDYKATNSKLQNLKMILKNEEQNVLETYQMLSEFNSNNLCTVLESFLEKLHQIMENKLMKATIPFISHNFESIFQNNIEKRFKMAQEQVCQERYDLSLAKFCEILSSQFNKQICHNQVAGDKSFEVTLKIDALSHSFSDAMNIHKNLINAKTIPPMISVENSLNISTSTSLEMRLKANWKNHQFSLDIVDGASISQTISTKLQGSLKAFLGPLSIGLAQAHIRLGEPEALTLKVIFNKNQPGRFAISGNADFASSIHIFDKEICRIGISVPNVYRYLEDGSGIEIDQRSCQGSFETALRKVFDEFSFFGFFRDPGVFVLQWKNSIGDAMKNWKSSGSFGKLLRLSAPLVKFAIPQLFEEGIRGLAGNDITNKFANEIQDIRDIIGGSEITNRTSMEQRALALFTETLYSVLPLREKPKVPNVKDPQYRWKLLLEKGISKTIAELDFQLGNKAWAKFKAKCTPKMELLLRFNITLVYEKNRGVYFHFDDEQVITSKFALPLQDCSLSGTLGILGADLKIKDNTAFGAGIDLRHNKDKWTWDYKLKSHLRVSAVAGIAGDVLKMRQQAGSNPLEQFLHFKMDMEFLFEHDFVRQPRPIIRMSDIQMCIGDFLMKLVGRFRKEAGRILDPLEKIAGPDSFLMKKIPPTKFIYGRTLTVGEYAILLASSDCEGVCEAVNVREILETYKFLTKILHIYSHLKPFLTGKGCGVIKRGSNFEVNMNNPKDIKHFGAEVADEVEIVDSSLEGRRGDIMGIWKDLTGKHGFNIEFNLTPKNIPKILVSILLGEDIDILAITIPPVRLGISAYFPITIYCCPPKVDLFFAVAIGIRIQVPKIILSTTGMAEAVRTRKIQHLGLGIKLQTRNLDGTPIPIIQGSFKITAGVSISVFIFNGRAWFYLELLANFYILDVNGSPYVTFDQVMNLPRHASFEIILQCGFGFDIRACIKILWKRKCWTLIRKNFGPYRLASWKIGGTSIPKAADHRGVNLDKAGSGENTYTFTEEYVSYAQNPNSIPLASTKMGNQINYFGNHRSLPMIYNIEDYPGLVVVPPSNNIEVNFDVSKFPDIDSIMINSNGVTPNTGSSGLRITTCKTVNINHPMYNNEFLLNGIPCEFNIDIKDSKIQLNGEMSSYEGKKLTLKESGDLIVNIPGTVYTIQTDKLLINDKQLFETTTYLNTLEINAKETDNVFQIKSTHAETDVRVNGGVGKDTFFIHNIWDIGKLVVNGIAGINDKIQTTLQIPQQGAFLRIFGTMLTAMDGNNLKKTIVTNNVPNKDIIIQSGDKTRTQVSIMPLDVHDHVKITTQNKPNSMININVTNCESRQNIRHFLNGGGSQTVFIGDGGSVSHLHCNIDIVGDDNNEYMVIIDAKKDSRKLQYWMNSGVDHSRIRIYDPVNTDFALVIATTNIKRMKFLFSHEETTQFVTIGTPKYTEYQLYYPNQYLNSKQMAQICSTSAGSNIAIFGVADISIGPKSFICEQQQLQLSGIQSQIAILGGGNSNDKSIIRMNLQGQKPHYSKVDNICYSPTDKDGNPNVKLEPLTNWMKDSLKPYNVENHLCFILYTPYTSSMHVTTGSGDDIIRAENVKFTTFDAHLGDGFNTLYYGKSLTPANLSSGNGGCRFTQESPSDKINLKLNAPGKNILDFYVKEFPASFTERGIGPIGPNHNTAYASFTVHKYDQVTMHSGKEKYQQ
eukprot:gene5901-9729_t